MSADDQLGPPTMGDHEDEARRAAAYGTTNGEPVEVVSRQVAVERAVASLLDVVQELCLGLAYGATPETRWAEIVESNFEEHRRELRAAE